MSSSRSGKLGNWSWADFSILTRIQDLEDDIGVINPEHRRRILVEKVVLQNEGMSMIVAIMVNRCQLIVSRQQKMFRYS